MDLEFMFGYQVTNKLFDNEVEFGAEFSVFSVLFITRVDSFAAQTN